MPKIPKAVVLYIDPRPEGAPPSNFVCGECIFMRDADRCAFYPMEEGPVSATRGGCNMYVDGAPEDDGYWPYLDKLVTGYMENENGFGCRRCKEFIPGSFDCHDVDKDSLGDNPGMISTRACCNNQTPDARRGRMTDEQLMIEMAPELEKANRKKALR